MRHDFAQTCTKQATWESAYIRAQTILDMFPYLSTSGPNTATAPYDGPYLIMSRRPRIFKVKIKKRSTWVSIGRLKPAFISEGLVSPSNTKDQPNKATRPTRSRSFLRPHRISKYPTGLLCVPRQQTKEMKEKRLNACKELLERYEIEDGGFLDRIVIGDESWIHHIIIDSKISSAEWHHKVSPTPKKPKITASAGKHHNARPHVENLTIEAINKLNFKILIRSPYSPDLAPSDYYLFGHLKRFQRGMTFQTDDEIKNAMLQTAYGDAAMSRRRVFEWYKRFKEGREETADNERSGRPSTSTTPEKVDKVLELDILGVRRLNAVLVPKDLTFDQKNARKETASLNLEATTNDPELLKRGIVHHEFQQQGSTITADSYLGALRRLREAIRRQFEFGRIIKSWILHHDNAPAHTALKISKFLQDHSTSVFPQPPYSPDLVPATSSFLESLKKLKGRKFQSIEEIKVESKKAIEIRGCQRATLAWDGGWPAGLRAQAARALFEHRLMSRAVYRASLQPAAVPSII
ncbi:hypothetical protein LAZ67_16002392 [Cordylochernes scorpioides]|uniref:Mos1 transposase HTH domain-containing protein n=1 Tax=Cordylochernes scorpioides TaxID=51811 RepID=A0ABY6LFL9_9ARAC|nr:hypothetical protein LAZ67_16002392 [Cordylochernes scorpioides]